MQFTIPILTPFPYVSVHVIQPQFVWQFHFHWFREYLVMPVVVIVIGYPCDVPDVVAAGEFISFAQLSSLRREFPFRLCGKPEVQSCGFIQF